jgi:hypothetical protein
MKYKVEFAKFRTVEIEADDKQEAESKALDMDGAEIETEAINNDDYEVWSVILSR